MWLTLIASLLSFAFAIRAQNFLGSVPSSIQSCYEQNPGPELCQDVSDISIDTLARCTCETFEYGESAALYNCIRSCSETDQSAYLVALHVREAYQCQEKVFPDITLPSSASAGASVAPSSTQATSAAPQTASSATSTAAAHTMANKNLMAAGGLLAALVL